LLFDAIDSVRRFDAKALRIREPVQIAGAFFLDDAMFERALFVRLVKDERFV